MVAAVVTARVSAAPVQQLPKSETALKLANGFAAREGRFLPHIVGILALVKLLNDSGVQDGAKTTVIKLPEAAFNQLDANIIDIGTTLEKLAIMKDQTDRSPEEADRKLNLQRHARSVQSEMELSANIALSAREARQLPAFVYIFSITKTPEFRYFKSQIKS